MATRLVLAALVALVSLCGCGYFRRVGECRRLAARVNGSLDEIAAAHDAGGATAATYRDLADRYDRLASEVDGFARGDAPLDRTLKEYAQAFQETARTLRGLSTALDEKDALAAGRLRRDLANHARRDRTLVTRLDALCVEP